MNETRSIENADPARAGRKRVIKAVAWGAGSVLATSIGAASIAIPVLADLMQQNTSTDTIAVLPSEGPTDEAAPDNAAVAAVSADLALDTSEVEPETHDGPGMQMSFWVPIDAPWAQFPDDGWQQDGDFGMFGCSQAQYDWLLEHSVPISAGGGLFDLVNTATDGGALSIRSIRAEGEFIPQSPARIKVECSGAGTGAGDDYTVVEVTLGTDAPATVVRSSVLPEGALFTRDLAPGELGQVFVSVATVDPTKDFEGRLVLDVIAGEEESTLTLQEGELWRSAPAVRAGVVNIDNDGHLRCVPLPVTLPLFDSDGWSTMPGIFGGEGEQCSPADLETWIKGLPVEY